MPINVFVEMPSCVPSRAGAGERRAPSSAPEDVAEAMAWPNIIGLGEMMNFPGRRRRRSEDARRDRRDAARRARRSAATTPRPTSGRPSTAYAAGGPADDHEGTRAEDAIARVRQGMRAMLRLGSAWYDVAAQIKAVTEKGLDPRNFILCTDDCHSGTLVNEGHMDRVVRHAIAQGLKPMTAIQMATLNTAHAFRAGARARLDRAGPAGRLHPDLRPARRCRSRR